jgi:hypothetical protein
MHSRLSRACREEFSSHFSHTVHILCALECSLATLNRYTGRMHRWLATGVVRESNILLIRIFTAYYHSEEVESKTDAALLLFWSATHAHFQTSPRRRRVHSELRTMLRKPCRCSSRSLIQLSAEFSAFAWGKTWVVPTQYH